jgi:predicted O-methyltransferase YrrM
MESKPSKFTRGKVVADLLANVAALEKVAHRLRRDADRLHHKIQLMHLKVRVLDSQQQRRVRAACLEIGPGLGSFGIRMATE